MAAGERVSEQEAWEKWLEIAPLIDRLMERVGDQHDFLVQPGSALAGDDKASTPYQVSHAFKQCLTVAVDHLHAARVLILGPGYRPHAQPIVHLSAHAALARGALENLAVAFWILHPNQRNLRIEHTLRWYVRNALDQSEALPEMGVPMRRSRDEMVRSLEQVMLARVPQVPRGFTRGYYSTGVVKYVEAHRDDAGLGVLTPWRLCSGFAHGRPWVSLGILEREEFPTDEPGVMQLRLTSDGTRTLMGPLAAMHLLEDVLKLFASRAGTDR